MCQKFAKRGSFSHSEMRKYFSDYNLFQHANFMNILGNFLIFHLHVCNNLPHHSQLNTTHSFNLVPGHFWSRSIPFVLDDPIHPDQSKSGGGALY